MTWRVNDTHPAIRRGDHDLILGSSREGKHVQQVPLFGQQVRRDFTVPADQGLIDVAVMLVTLATFIEDQLAAGTPPRWIAMQAALAVRYIADRYTWS